MATIISAAPVTQQGRKSAYQRRRLGFNPPTGKIPWRRKWQFTAVFLPGESHGQRSLVGYSPRGRKESDMTEDEDSCLIFSNCPHLDSFQVFSHCTPKSEVREDVPGVCQWQRPLSLFRALWILALPGPFPRGASVSPGLQRGARLHAGRLSVAGGLLSPSPQLRLSTVALTHKINSLSVGLSEMRIVLTPG